MLPDETRDEFEYDLQGNLVLATSSTGVFSFERDKLGRVVRERQRVAGEEHWIESAHGKAGNRVRLSSSLGYTETVVRDPMGERVTTLLDEDRRVEHETDVLGREIARRLPDGPALERSFDALGRLANQAVRVRPLLAPASAGEPDWIGRRDTGITSSQSYRYDADGELIARYDSAHGLTRYEYDPVGQLLAATRDGARTEIFTYDPAGNMYEAAPGDPQREYAAGGRTLRRGHAHYRWDDAGRLVERRHHTGDRPHVWSYSWNGAGLLSRVEASTGTRVNFEYDPFGRRVTKELGDGR